MRRTRHLSVLLLATLLPLTACSGGDDSSKGDPSASPTSSSSVAPEDRPPAKVKTIESGFGQQGTRVAAVAVVRNTSPTDGQTLRVDFTLLGPGGQQVATVTRQLTFLKGDETAVAVGFGDLTGLDVRRIVKVKVTSTAENADVSGTLPDVTVKAQGVKPSPKGPVATFAVTNQGKALPAIGLAVACRDAKGRIIGGGLASGGKVKAKGSTTVTASDLVVSGRPASCEASPVTG